MQATGKPDFALERAAGAPGRRIGGIDEAGRGAWAGPVVAAAVVLDAGNIPDGVQDSKRLGRAARERLFDALTRRSAFAVGIVGRDEIDRGNILQASLEAMRLAARQIMPAVAEWLIDGRQVPDGLPGTGQAVVGGDGRSLSIAAASIVAKITRDRIMTELARRHPGYGWERNAGYGTAAHRDGLRRLGVCCEHRASYKPIQKFLQVAT